MHVQTSTARIHDFHLSLPNAPPAGGTSTENSIKRAPDREGHWHIQGFSQYPRSNSLTGSHHHDDDRPLCRRPQTLSLLPCSRAGEQPARKPICHLVG